MDSHYDQVMQILHDENPYVFLYHQNVVLGMSSKVAGYTFVPDGIIRAITLEKK